MSLGPSRRTANVPSSFVPVLVVLHLPDAAGAPAQGTRFVIVLPLHQGTLPGFRSGRLPEVFQAVQPGGRTIIVGSNGIVKPPHDLAGPDPALVEISDDHAGGIYPAADGDVGLTGRVAAVEVDAEPVYGGTLGFVDGDGPGEGKGYLPARGGAAALEFPAEGLEDYRASLAVLEADDGEFLHVRGFRRNDALEFFLEVFGGGIGQCEEELLRDGGVQAGYLLECDGRACCIGGWFIFSCFGGIGTGSFRRQSGGGGLGMTILDVI